jgi:hypothetical protein
VLRQENAVNQGKAAKRQDFDLWSLISQKITGVRYIFLNHAKERLVDRKITDIEVLDILEHKDKCRRNKSKDSYIPGYPDWKYCIEGKSFAGQPNIRVIISFDKEFMLVITVIRLDVEERVI